uniref:Uncharacterized protein n=1 Tax=Romanomermis culicivorax TaxID=13658 RepID=A0A915J8X3_ROMCU
MFSTLINNGSANRHNTSVHKKSGNCVGGQGFLHSPGCNDPGTRSSGYPDYPDILGTPSVKTEVEINQKSPIGPSLGTFP